MQPPDRGCEFPADPEIAAAIGGYRVIRQLGQGGFGRVYLARDDNLARDVAIKVPGPEPVASSDDVEALVREARCYLPNAKGQYDNAMTVPADVLKRNGYRLLTEAEWEFACRAGALTSRSRRFLAAAPPV